MFSVTRKISMRSTNFCKKINFMRNLSVVHDKLTIENVEEVKIPVPWGHISGKWWGSNSQQPIICLHGWQDNANTFNNLVPHLPSKNSYLSVDLPGHGLSSHLPRGFSYKPYEVISMLRRIQRHFDWSKVSLIGHSYGGATSFMYSSCFPDDVDFFVAIDTFKPLSKYAPKDCNKMSKTIEKLLRYDSFQPESIPYYKRKDLIERWIKGSENSLTKESCEILMERGTEERNGLFKLNRDNRLKAMLSPSYTQEEVLKMAESITCNVLFIKAKGSSYFEQKENVVDVVEVVKNKAKYFEYHELEGTHHIHLNTPEVVAPVINSFIKTIEVQQ